MDLNLTILVRKKRMESEFNFPTQFSAVQMMRSFCCLYIDGKLQLWKQQSWWKAHRKPAFSLSPFLSRTFVVSKWSKVSAGEKQITEVNDRKGKPWKFYSPWKTDVPEGRGQIVTLEPSGVGFWTSQPHFRIGSMLSLVLGYGKLPSQGISFLPLQW